MVSKVSPDETNLQATGGIELPSRIDTTMHQDEHKRVNSAASLKDNSTDEIEYMAFDVSPTVVSRGSTGSRRKSKAWFDMTEEQWKNNMQKNNEAVRAHEDRSQRYRTRETIDYISSYKFGLVQSKL